MSRDRVEAVVRQLFDAHNLRSAALLDGLFTSDYVYHAAPGGQQGAEGRRQQIAMFITAAPDLNSRIDGLLVDGDTAAVRWTTRATITGAPVQTPLGPVEPRDQKTQLSGVNIIRTRGSQIAEEWIYWDQVSWLQQLGAISKPGK